MKFRKITIVAEGVGEGNEILYCPLNCVLVNEKPVPHHGFSIGLENEDGFLTLTLLNVEEEAFNEFMADETPSDVLEGTGVPTFTTERSSEDMNSHGPDELTWTYGANIVLPIHDLELRVKAPVGA